LSLRSSNAKHLLAGIQLLREIPATMPRSIRAPLFDHFTVTIPQNGDRSSFAEWPGRTRRCPDHLDHA
jgi:hypothetical protein